MMDVYTPSLVPGYTRRPNCWTRARIDVPYEDCPTLCTMKEAGLAVWSICSYMASAPVKCAPQSFWEVMVNWGYDWLWENLRVVGPSDWLATAIAEGTCIGVTDGSYMRDLRRDICSAAFFFESADGTCKLVGSFAERSEVANAYRGELLGLMALHLILLAVNKVHPGLQGSVTLHSDCLGALSRVENLPPGKVPAACKHADVLKNILMACGQLSFQRNYVHIEAHQDEEQDFHLLSRAAQLNCAVDAGAKWALITATEGGILRQQAFPLEPLTCFAGDRKITPDAKAYTHFWIHKILARQALSDMKVLHTAQFDEIAWDSVHSALYTVPRMFQVWACKQVLDIANTNYVVSKWDKAVNPLCPSCLQVRETSEHVLLCSEAGRVNILLQTVDLLDGWLRKMGTHPQLREVIIRFCKGRGFIRMAQVCRQQPDFSRMARSQDIIGWRRFMEGMVSAKIIEIQREFFVARGMSWKLERWATGLVVRLLEIAHGQWLYRNVVVHDSTRGRLALARKEDIAAQIEAQLEQGGEGLLEEDLYLMDINLGDLHDATGESHAYWLLAIQAARVAGQLHGEVRPMDGLDYG